MEVFDKFAPVKKCTTKNKKHWLTKEVVVACRRRDEAHKQMISKPSIENCENFRKLKSFAKSATRNAIRNFYDPKMNNCSDASSKFKVFNTFSNKYREQKCKIDVDTMNDFFANIGQRLADSIKKQIILFLKVFQLNKYVRFISLMKLR